MQAAEKAAPDPARSGLWTDGWYRFAHRLDSPNFGPRPAASRCELLVIHSISLPPGQYGTGHVQRLFTNQLDWDAHPYFAGICGLEVSAHFFITRDGQLWQFVSCNDRAWHAGTSSWRGKPNCNDDSVGIELEGLEGQAFEAAQYDSLASVAAALMAAYPVVDLMGHEHIAPGRKLDPGPGFDWPLLARSLGLPASRVPASPST